MTLDLNHVNIKLQLKELIMNENVYKGDLLTSTAEIIAHQVNASGGFGSGVAGAVKNKYPRVAEQYHKACEKGLMKLGMCQIVKTNPNSDDNRLVANLCGQERYGYDGQRYTNYEGIFVALEKLSLSQRDYRNSIKESISAVECVCREITSESTLDRALKNLENKGVVLNPRMKDGLKNLYFYTNDGSTGIRHALMDDANAPTADEAIFMLVSCSAFVNYLMKKK